MGLDDSLEDERDLDQIIQDRRAADLELDAREVCVIGRKLPELLHGVEYFWIGCEVFLD